jgi:hypothetical protein
MTSTQGDLSYSVKNVYNSTKEPTATSGIREEQSDALPTGQKQHVPPKRRYTSTRLHGVTNRGQCSSPSPLEKPQTSQDPYNSAALT